MKRPLYLLATTLAMAMPAAFAADSTHDPKDHHPRADAGLMAFHELMEPIWHATPGPALNVRACAIGSDIEARAKAAAKRPTPDHAALLTAARALRSACTDRNDPGITGELDRLHQIFHKLAGMGGR